VILLDTHVLIWLLADSKRISAPGHAAIARERKESNSVAISAVTLLEIAVLTRKQRIFFGTKLDALLADIDANFLILPIGSHNCRRLIELPPDYPSDPVDQMIGATALAEGIPLITADEKIRKAKAFETIW